MKRAMLLATCVAVLAVTAPAHATTGASVRGGGSGTFPATFGSIAGDRLHLEISATTLPDGTVHGTFQLLHRHVDGSTAAELHGVVSCLSVSGTQASASGTITGGKVNAALGFDPAGQTFAVTIVDGAAGDTAGLDLSFFGGAHTIPACEQVPTYLAIDEGAFSIDA